MNFGASIGMFRTGTLDKHEKVRRGVCLKLFGAIIKDTPVLTGALRANWLCSIGQPDLSTVHKGTAEAVQLMTEKTMTSQPDDMVILTNRLPYVFRIEYEGHSKQKAPQGMVRRNVSRFRQLISSQTKSLT